MTVKDLMSSLSDEVAQCRSRHADMRLDRLTGLVDSAVDAVDAELETMRTALLSEVQALAATIALARDEVARLRSEHEGDASPIPDATDELDAIVQHTADATETILDASERLDDVALTLPENAQTAISAQTIRIYEACSFQDITGQRISKVVAALKLIEARILRITGAYETGTAPPHEVARDPLLNGPQSQEAAMDQDAIDRLLTF